VRIRGLWSARRPAGGRVAVVRAVFEGAIGYRDVRPTSPGSPRAREIPLLLFADIG